MNGNVNASRQRLTLSNLTEPQQMRELNRQLEWIWAQLMGGLSRKSLSSGLQSVIDGKADGETVTSLSTRIEQAEDEIALKASNETVNDMAGAYRPATRGSRSTRTTKQPMRIRALFNHDGNA